MNLLTSLATLPVESSAPLLLGCHLAVDDIVVQIVEVEAYGDEADKASHAWRGPTPRNRPMYGPPGRAYVYFTYGNHWMLNVVARPEGEAAAVLVRAARLLKGEDVVRLRRIRAKSEPDLLYGPGRLCQGLAIGEESNLADLFDPSSRLRLVESRRVDTVWCGPRVGLSETRDADRPWRFIDLESAQWASRPRPKA